MPVLFPLTGGAALGAIATAWTDGSPAVPAVAVVAVAIAAAVVLAQRRPRRGAALVVREPPAAALPRAAQRVTAALVLVLVLPLLLVVALAVELTSRGPVLLRRPRAGAGPMLAFRCTDQRGRTTRLGGVLRRSSLDGLPGLFDVVAGRVVLPGPALTSSGTTPPRGTRRHMQPR